MKHLLHFLILSLASCFYLSYLPAKIISQYKKSIKGQTLTERRWTGAGFVGSLFGLAMYLFLPISFSQSWVALSVGFVLAVVVSHFAERILMSHDDSRIVIDEWIGVWIALFGFAPVVGAKVITAFILFRFFDVIKGPWGKWLQKLPGGFGITMDDVAAGVMANLLTRFFFQFLS